MGHGCPFFSALFICCMVQAGVRLEVLCAAGLAASDVSVKHLPFVFSEVVYQCAGFESQKARAQFCLMRFSLFVFFFMVFGNTKTACRSCRPHRSVLSETIVGASACSGHGAPLEVMKHA